MHRSSSPPSDSAAQRAYTFAKWAILSAVYQAGDVITEGGLAHEIGVGRTPAREALLRLEARALVENHTAARSFANRAELLPRVETVHEDMRRRRRERDTAGFTECDRVFQELIVDAAGNAVLSAVYRTLRERQTLFTSVMMRGRPDRMDAAIAEHEEILATLRGDDVAVFCDTVNAHLEWSAALATESH